MTTFDEDCWELFSETQENRSPCANRKKYTTSKCGHLEIVDNICISCGCEIQVLDFKPEWSFYGVFDNKFSRDPSRCSMIKKKESNLDSLFSKYKLDVKFNDKVKNTTLDRYNMVTQNSTHRGIKKKSIVAVCLFYVLKEEGDIRTSEEIRKLFKYDIDKKDMSRGRQKYCEVMKEMRSGEITKPSALISGATKEIGLDPKHNIRIQKLTKILENTSSQLTRSSPQSVAAAIIYLYLSLNRRLKERYCNKNFFIRVGVSEVTVKKLIDSIDKVLKS